MGTDGQDYDTGQFVKSRHSNTRIWTTKNMFQILKFKQGIYKNQEVDDTLDHRKETLNFLTM
jgi:hypothetical protein